MTRRNKIIIGSVIGILLLIGLIILIIWLGNRPGVPGVVSPTPQPGGLQVPANLPGASAPLPVTPAGPVKEVKVEANLKAIITTFTERYGSYSTQGNFANLDSLKGIASKKMIAYLDSLKTRQNAQNYSGISTQVLIVEMSSFEENIGRAQAKVTTVRQESTNTTINSTGYYQELTVNLVKEDGTWKVDSAEWGIKK